MNHIDKLNKRAINGILLLDKPEGITSNAALQSVKRLLKAKKAGHTGSLDKMASGLLPLCFGEATKFSGYLLDSDKFYRATCQLGIKTTTGDAMGETVKENSIPELSEKIIESVLEKFRGKITQVPPMYSALKHQGNRLYKLAYQGIVVEREPRTIFIHELKLCDFSTDRIQIEVRCSKGTYIRTLVEDIGDLLGCGAHVAALRRLGAGPFTADQMIKIEKLENMANASIQDLESVLHPTESALPQFAQIELSENIIVYLQQGQAVLVPHAPTEGMVKIFNKKSDFLGIGVVQEDGKIAPKRLVHLDS